MVLRSPPLLALGLLALLALGTSISPSQGQTPRPTFPRSTLYVEGNGQRHLLRVEVADTPERWAHGLMFRERLGEDEGMVFLFPRPQGGGFWMKNTLIPLSIAFFNREGQILRTLDMEPCPKDPCPIYYPGVLYEGALEVVQGWFHRRGLGPGARVSGPALRFWPRP